ncbi:MAG: Spi family protease inhibitor, partial [Bacteroidales bacterium]|nr:Spi family protease inhibitor [Bacteroidales bacterium]
MKNKTIIYISIMAITAISCSSNDKIEQPVNMERVSNESTIIPVDEAIKTLNNFLADTKMIATKSGSQREIASIETHLSDSNKDDTRKSIPDAYLVNFKDEEGFAILGANTSIDPVIAVIEDGNTSWEEIMNPAEDIPSSFDEDCPDPGISPDRLLSIFVNNALTSKPETKAGEIVYGPYDLEILPLTQDIKFNQQVTYCHKKNRGYVICGCAATALSIASAYNKVNTFTVDHETLDLSKCNTLDGLGLYYVAKGYPIYVQTSDYFTNYTAIPSSLTESQKIDLLEQVGPGIKAKHSPITFVNSNALFNRTQYKLISTIFYRLDNIREKWDYTATMPSAVSSLLKELGYTNVKSNSSKAINAGQFERIRSMLENNKPVI